MQENKRVYKKQKSKKENFESKKEREMEMKEEEGNRQDRETADPRRIPMNSNCPT